MPGPTACCPTSNSIRPRLCWPGAAETRGEVTGEVEAGHGATTDGAERKRHMDAEIRAAYDRADVRSRQVGWPKPRSGIPRPHGPRPDP